VALEGSFGLVVIAAVTDLGLDCNFAPWRSRKLQNLSFRLPFTATNAY